MWSSGGRVIAHCLTCSEARELEAKCKDVKTTQLGKEMSVSSVKAVWEAIVAMKEISVTKRVWVLCRRTTEKSLETLPSKAIGYKTPNSLGSSGPSLSLAYRWPSFSCPSLYTQLASFCVRSSPLYTATTVRLD